MLHSLLTKGSSFRGLSISFYDLIAYQHFPATFLFTSRHQFAPGDTAMFSIFGNSTNIVSWVDDPHSRGTLEILTSCIVTIFLCVWTALHLNLPLPINAKQPWYAKRQFWRKIGWLILTLLAPEMAMYTACSNAEKPKE